MFQLVKIMLLFPLAVCVMREDSQLPPLVDKPREMKVPGEISFDVQWRYVFTPDGQTMMIVDPKGGLIVWDLKEWKESKRLPPETVRNWCFTVSGDGKRLAVVTMKNTVRVLETGTLKQLAEIEPEKVLGTLRNYPRLSNDGKVLAQVAEDKIWLLDVQTGKVQAGPLGHLNTIRAYMLSPDGKLLVSGSGERGSRERPDLYPAELKFWDVATGKELFSCSGKLSWIYKVVFSPDGKLLAVWCDDRTVRVWDVAKRSELYTIKHKGDHGGSITGVAFSKDGKWVITVAFFGEITAWDASTGKAGKTILSGYKINNGVTFSPSGEQVLIHSDEGIKVMWLTEAAKKDK